MSDIAPAEKSGILQGFKDFVMRGNVIDLAVAVVVGAAFAAVVKAFADYVINPIIAALGGGNVHGLAFQLVDGNEKSIVDFGAVITAAITFLITMLVVYFVFVLPMNTWKERQAAKAGVVEEEEEKLPTEQELLIQIRDLLERSSTPKA